MDSFSHLSVPHCIQHVIDILEDNFNISDLNVRYPRDLESILNVIEYIRVYDTDDNSSNHDKGLFQDLRSMIELMRNKVHLLTSIRTNSNASIVNATDSTSITELLRGLHQEDFFHISDLCYNHLYKINDAYNDIETDNWSVTDNLSPNLLSLFDKPSTSDSKVSVNYNNWIKPAYHGLENSLPIVIVKKSNDNTAVDGDDDDDDDNDSSVSYGIESSDDGGLKDPDSYVMHSALSNSLSSLFNIVRDNNPSNTVNVDANDNVDANGGERFLLSRRPVSMGIKWQAPSSPGLSNSTRKLRRMHGWMDDDDDADLLAPHILHDSH